MYDRRMEEEYMTIKIFDDIDFVDDDDLIITEKNFEKAEEIEEELNTYKGCWAELYNSNDLILAGNFDSTFLIEEFY